MPSRIDASAARAPMCDFAGRENDERTAAFEPEMCRPEAGLTASRRRRAVKRVDEEADVREFRDPRQEVIGENPDVCSHAAHDGGEHKAVDGSARVVCGDDKRACRRDLLKVCGLYGRPDPQRVEDPVRK
jgi:hypothetical protein